MQVSYDPKKDGINRRKHGISLARASEFDLTSALIDVDDAEDYGEVRYVAIGFIGADLYPFTHSIREETVRAISRRASTREERERYAG